MITQQSEHSMSWSHGNNSEWFVFQKSNLWTNKKIIYISDFTILIPMT